MGFEENINLWLDLIEVNAGRIRRAANERRLREIRDYLEVIRDTVRKIGHEVTEKEVTQI